MWSVQALLFFLYKDARFQHTLPIAGLDTLITESRLMLPRRGTRILPLIKLIVDIDQYERIIDQMNIEMMIISIKIIKILGMTRF